MKVMVIQGPNLNMLGLRETSIYGAMKLDDIHERMKEVCNQHGSEIEFFHSNYEGEIVDKIQECLGTVDGIIINPAAYSHTSIAIRDALSAVKLPVMEVHVSNIHAREEFRQKSIISPITDGVVVGFGPIGYHLALIAMLQLFDSMKKIKEQQTEA